MLLMPQSPIACTSRIHFVRLNDPDLAEEYSLDHVPALVYFRHSVPLVFNGELGNEEEVMEFLYQNR